MGDLFKTISGGFARYALAWFLPTLISVGLFIIVLVLPHSDAFDALNPLIEPAEKSGLTAAVIISFFVMTISVLLAYGGLPIYRFLEGYTVPKPIAKFLLRKQRRRFSRLKALESRWIRTGNLPTGLDLDVLRCYPDTFSELRPTRLGNALASMESWSRNRYHLDSQTMWYELVGVSSEEVKKNTEETRAPVDFFISCISNAILLAAGCMATWFAATLPAAAILGALSLLTIPVTYRLAVKNVIDWSQAVKAMVNLSRRELASGLGLRVDQTLELERRMWSSHHYAIEFNQAQHVPSLDTFRLPPPPP